MALVMALLAGSGFCALVYQVLWLRLLGLVFGVTVHAASTVLAAFMGGLAVGSLVAGRLADRSALPLRWFGAAEIAIAGAALATPWVLGALESVYRAVYDASAGHLTAMVLARFVASCAALIVPAGLMGATVPLALRAVVSARGFGTRAAALYGANTAGALAGAVAAGYLLIAQLGVSASFRLAALINATVGIVAWLAAPRLARGLAAEPVSADAGADADAAGTVTDGTRRLVLAVFVLSGFVGLALEVIWFRALVMYVPATTYVFTIVLAVVLGGLAAGSAIATQALRRPRDWVAVLAVLQIAVAVAAISSLALQGWTYSRGWRTGAALQAAGLSVLPAMLLMGAAFPIGLSLWTLARPDALRRAGDAVGRFYLANLTGAIAGATAAGFVLIPALGLRQALVAVAALSLVSGCALLVSLARRRPGYAIGTAVAGVALFAVVSATLADPLTIVLSRRYPGERLLWRHEGVQSTVTVHQGEQRAMYLDGLHQANDSAAMTRIHGQIGTLAMALHPDPERALVIGLGGGVTPGAVAAFGRTAVDVVELSAGVVRGAEWFRHVNGDLLRRPNVRLRLDDGRNHLLLSRERYDVLTADIIQPFHAGAGSLYSLEYFRLAARALEDDGLMLQWIGQRPQAQYRLIARTFLEAFPHTTVWGNGTLLVGTLRPLEISAARYGARLDDPDTASALRSAGLDSFEALAATYTASAAELRAFIGNGPVLTDDRPLVEFFLSLPAGEPDIDLSPLRGDVTPLLRP